MDDPRVVFDPRRWLVPGNIHCAMLDESQDDEVGKVTDAIVRALREHGITGDKHFIDAISLLLAVAGAPRQAFHFDFDDRNENEQMYKGGLASDGTVPFPLSCLAALEEGVTMTVKKKGKDGEDLGEEIIKVPRLGVMVFRGDLEHAGSAYTTRNVRMHVYIGIKDGVRRVGAPRDANNGLKVAYA